MIGFRVCLFSALIPVISSCLTVYNNPILVPKGSVNIDTILMYPLQPSLFGYKKFSGKKSTAVEFLIRKAKLEFQQHLLKNQKTLETRAGAKLLFAGPSQPFLSQAPGVPPAKTTSAGERILYGKYSPAKDRVRSLQYQMNRDTLMNAARNQAADGILVPFIEFVEKPYRVNVSANRFCHFKNYLYAFTYYLLFSNEGEVLLDSRAFSYSGNLLGFEYRRGKLMPVLSYSFKGKLCRAFVNPDLHFTDFPGALDLKLIGSLK